MYKSKAFETLREEFGVEDNTSTGITPEERIQSIIDRIKIPFEWSIKLRFHDHAKQVPYIVIADDNGVCNVTGKEMKWEGRPWTLNPGWSEMEIVRTIHKAVLTAVEHEINERFLVDNVPIYNPHRNLID